MPRVRLFAVVAAVFIVPALMWALLVLILI